MLHYSYSLDQFCLLTMIPIPKGSNKDLCVKNHRDIALGSIFDNSIISAECVALNSNDLQFAYQSGAQHHNVFLYYVRQLTIIYTN